MSWGKSTQQRPWAVSSPPPPPKIDEKEPPPKVEKKPAGKSKLANAFLAVGEIKVRTFNLLMKMVQSTLSVLLVFIHAGELHVMNSPLQSKVGIAYTTSMMAFPIYFIARSSSAVWKRRWIPDIMDAVMNFIASLNYLGMFFCVLMNLNIAEDLRNTLKLPKQRTELIQLAVYVRLLINFILFVLLLFEALTHFMRTKLHKLIVNAIQKRKEAAEAKMLQDVQSVLKE